MILNAKDLIPLMGMIHRCIHTDMCKNIYFADIQGNEDLHINIDSASIEYHDIHFHSIALVVECHIETQPESIYEIEIPLFSFSATSPFVYNDPQLSDQKLLVLHNKKIHFFDCGYTYKQGVMFKWDNIVYINKVICGKTWIEWAEHCGFKVVCLYDC